MPREVNHLKKVPTKVLIAEAVATYSETGTVEVDEGVLSETVEIRFGGISKFCKERLDELARRKGCDKATFYRMLLIKAIKMLEEQDEL